MRPIRWIVGRAHALRGLVERVHRRTDRLPQLPFGIAVGIAIMLVLVALESGSDPEARVSDVDELVLPDVSEQWSATESVTPAALEIVEFGFGAVTDQQGVERLSLGAVIRNPHDADVLGTTLAVIDTGDDGVPIERVYLNQIDARAEVPIGQILLEPADGVDASELTLQVEDAQLWNVEEADGPFLYGRTETPQISLAAIEPLFSPEGYRVNYQIETDGTPLYYESVKIALVFRDAEGSIVGGMPAWGLPFRRAGEELGWRTYPPGISQQHLDVPATYIPEGTDLDRIEIGPGA
ncbi:hypothetical protein [Glycomyces tarimensis]